MSKFDAPNLTAIRRGVLLNKAARAYMAKPLPGLEELCTEKAIVEGRPVIVVYRFGYVSTSSFDYEDGNTTPHGIGELIEVRPLEPDDEFHPNKVLVIYRATLPKTNRAGDPAKPPRKPKAAKVKPAAAAETVAGEEADDAEALARELGLL